MRIPAKLVLVSVMIAVAMPSTHAGPAQAATIVVTNLNNSGLGSLRQAILDAAPGDTIEFGVTGTITLTGGALVIDKDLAINGPGAPDLEIDGNHNSHVLHIVGGSVYVEISGVTIQNGGNTTEGAGIWNSGTLTLTDSLVSGNSALSEGGGIWNNGTLTLTNTTVDGNEQYMYDGGFGGGGIYNSSPGVVTVTNSTISRHFPYQPEFPISSRWRPKQDAAS